MSISYAVFCLKKKKKWIANRAFKMSIDSVRSSGVNDRCRSKVSGTALFFFFNDTSPTEIYTLSLHDALPILTTPSEIWACARPTARLKTTMNPAAMRDRKSTRLNSSHMSISYAVFCLKKKKKNNKKLMSKTKKKTTNVK